MYQTVLKRYELISPYPFFVAVKVFLITCLVLLVFVFSLVSPTESQDFLVLHMCEWASSLLSHPSGYPDCMAHPQLTVTAFAVSRSSPYSGLWVFLCSHWYALQATLAFLLQRLLLSYTSVLPLLLLFYWAGLTKCIPRGYTSLWRARCLVGHFRQCLRERDISTGKTGAQESWLALGQTGRWKVNPNLNPTQETTATEISFCLTASLLIWMPLSLPFSSLLFSCRLQL